jgi:hypothetical protein
MRVTVRFEGLQPDTRAQDPRQDGKGGRQRRAIDFGAVDKLAALDGSRWPSWTRRKSFASGLLKMSDRDGGLSFVVITRLRPGGRRLPQA